MTAADLGLSVVLLDAGRRPGGQYYRSPAPGLGAERPQALHHDWQAFASREARLRKADRVEYHPETHVWTVLPNNEGWTLHARTNTEQPTTVHARAVLLATGAYERQLPFPGWTLPGVVGAGGAQAMLKSGLVLPGRRVVVAGSGPPAARGGGDARRGGRPRPGGGGGGRVHRLRPQHRHAPAEPGEAVRGRPLRRRAGEAPRAPR
ncbi:hypothetical protein GCM10019017_22120 [Streptomyces showdoensis]